MRIDILTLFPEMCEPLLDASILGRARANGVVTVKCTDIRLFADGKHSVTDDTPYGGGAGMVMKVEPIVRAIEALVGDEGGEPEGRHIALMSAAGIPFKQQRAFELSQIRHLILIAGRYEGVDDRVCDYIDDEMCIGDYVLTGGELAALVITDAVVRLLPGAVGNQASVQQESFIASRLEYPQYTRPIEFAQAEVPDVLRSGDHKKIAAWRNRTGLERTVQRRPDLLREQALSTAECMILDASNSSTIRQRS